VTIILGQEKNKQKWHILTDQWKQSKFIKQEGIRIL